MHLLLMVNEFGGPTGRKSPNACCAGLEYAIDLSTSSGEADSENATDDSDSDEVSIADLVGNFSDGLNLEHAFPVFYNDIHDSGGKCLILAM